MLFSPNIALEHSSKLLQSNRVALNALSVHYPVEYMAHGNPPPKWDIGVPLMTRMLEKRIDDSFHYIRVLQHYWQSTLATQAAAEYALENGCGINLGGGFHHATLNPKDANNGCLVNDIVWTIKKLDVRSLVLDADFHCGGGTLQEESNEWNKHDLMRVIDVHGHGPHSRLSDTWAVDSDVLGPVPDSFAQDWWEAWDWLWELADYDYKLLFYNAGADVCDSRFAGSKALTVEQVAVRDRSVVDFCKVNGIPLCITLGGGYNDDAVTCWKNLIDYCLSRYR